MFNLIGSNAVFSVRGRSLTLPMAAVPVCLAVPILYGVDNPVNTARNYPSPIVHIVPDMREWQIRMLMNRPFPNGHSRG